MTHRIKFWFLAAALGALPLVALAFLSRPTAAAAGLRYVAPGDTVNGAIGTPTPTDTPTPTQTNTPAATATSAPLSVNQIIEPVYKTITETSVYTVTNLGLATANTAHSFYQGGYPGGTVAYTLVAVVPVSGSMTVDLGTLSGFPSAFEGDVVISADQPITSTVQTNLNPTATPTPSPTPTATAGFVKLYLPLVARPLPGIQGYVTFNGAPAANVYLELRHFDGTSFYTQLSGYTDANGFYDFQPPSLPAGQYYYVRFRNTGGTPGQLGFWGTAPVNTFTAGGIVGEGSFDLADVSLVSPASGATVAIPTLFQWVIRPAMPTDSYQLTLFDPNSSAFGQTGLLGYVNSVNVTGVSNAFHSGTPYLWQVWINRPDGSYGISYHSNWVTFTNILAGSQPAVAGGAVLAPATRPVDRPRP